MIPLSSRRKEQGRTGRFEGRRIQEILFIRVTRVPDAPGAGW